MCTPFEFWATIGADYRERGEMPPKDIFEQLSAICTETGEELPEYPGFPIANGNPGKDKGSGIYGIVRDGKIVYVGQACSNKGGFGKRWGQHRNLTSVGNVHLKNAIKKHGVDAVQFIVLEYIDAGPSEESHAYRLRLTAREQMYLDVIRVCPDLFYNLKLEAAPGMEWERLSEEQREASRKRASKMHEDPVFYAANIERLKALNADPVFAAAKVIRTAAMHLDPSFVTAHLEGMRKLHADPVFAVAHAERLQQRHLDPIFAEANADRLRELHADPVFAAARDERWQKQLESPDFWEARNAGLQKLWDDPEYVAGLADQMRRMQAEPVFAAAHSERMVQMQANKRAAKGLPPMDKAAILFDIRAGLSRRATARKHSVERATISRIVAATQAASPS